jgi:hypothetical protein
VEIDEEGAAGIGAVVDAKGVAFHEVGGRDGRIVISTVPQCERKPDPKCLARSRLEVTLPTAAMKITRLFALAAVSLSFSAMAQNEEGFVTLFNGKNLEGWEQHSGAAEYRVEDGAVVGKTVANTGNSFLCTTKKYGDFVLDLEFKVDPSMNSGIQFRSNFYTEDTEVEIDGKKKKFPADRVHGYQFEIDPSPRAFTGGVYDEGRRGWLFDLKNNEPARKAFKQGEWNKARIECKGDSIRTFINDVPAADFKDALTKEGVIALQVHGIGKKTEAVGKEVRWRNIRIKELK